MRHAVIMAGGKGTRFWPLSRAKKAKQFLTIVGDKTLLDHTLLRALPLVGENLWIVGNQGQSHYLAMAKDLIPSSHILAEPFGRNTAASIAWAASTLVQRDPDAIMAVLPADHMIQSPSQFRHTLKKAFDLVQREDVFVTIGIPPTHPHTGYGYIEATSGNTPISSVHRFCEKPDLETAGRFIAQGNFYWNAGIFVWRAASILTALHRFVPEMRPALDIMRTTKRFTRTALKALYAQLPNISIDYAVMEKSASQTRVIKATFQWDDIGNWTAMDNYWAHDKQQNAHRATLVSHDSHRNIVYSDKTVALIDVSDMIVVDTPDALLVVPKSSDQKIRLLYDNLPKRLQ